MDPFCDLGVTVTKILNVASDLVLNRLALFLANSLQQLWSPNGYDRAVELFEQKFFDGSHFFRVVPNFLVQFGISYSEDKNLQKLARTQIQDDPPQGKKFRKGTISYAGECAMFGAETRSLLGCC